jgi:lipoprotein-anchoring transpeptidase ErfK/SrfK/predicted negative regulator of RcsB-dependent stress response
MPKRRKEPGLFRFIVALILLGGVAFGVLRVAQWFQDRNDVKVEAAAADNLELARKLTADKKFDEAQVLLDPILTRVNNPAFRPEAHLLQANILIESDRKREALEHLRAAALDYPTFPDRQQTALRYARLLDELGRTDDAMAQYEDIRRTAPPAMRAEAALALAKHHTRNDNMSLADELFASILRDAEWGSDAWFEAAHRQGRRNVEAIFSHLPTEDSQTYRVERGDSLTTIGIKLNTTLGLLMYANNMDNPHTLRPNQMLKYTPKDFEIVIDRSRRLLYLFDGGDLFHVYRVGLGKPGQDTTLGRYRIGNKEKDPTWFKPGSEPIPAGDPRNELGTRWMPLIPDESGLPTDLGIHGTIAPESIGKYTSMGCPRLLNEQVEELYDLVVRSTPVRIVDSFEPPNPTIREARYRQ